MRAPSSLPEAPRSLRIVVADRDPVARRLLIETLEPLGHRLAVTEDGAEARTHAGADQTDVLIVDWDLPGGAAPALVHRLRAEAGERYLYVIALTALGRRNPYTAVVEGGADDLLLKPFDPRELVARLHVAARIASLTTQVRQLEQLLPVCAYCHRIRDDGGAWHRLEVYLEDRAGVQVSHGLCPACYQTIRRVQLGEP